MMAFEGDPNTGNEGDGRDATDEALRAAGYVAVRSEDGPMVWQEVPLFPEPMRLPPNTKPMGASLL